MKKRLIIYLACLFACLIASCSEKDEVISNGGEPQSYVPFDINKGVNISNWLSQTPSLPTASHKPKRKSWPDMVSTTSVCR